MSEEPRIEKQLDYISRSLDGEQLDKPVVPCSRIEIYLDDISDKIGGSGGGSGILVGIVDQTSKLPTTRPDGSPLQNEDYVKPKSEATFPFTIDGLTFANRFSKGIYFNSSWTVDAGLIQDTAETPLANPTFESFDVDAKKYNQSDLNKEFSFQLKMGIMEYEDLDTIPNYKKYHRIYRQTTDTEARREGLYWYDFDAEIWVPFAPPILEGDELPSVAGLKGDLFLLLSDVEKEGRKTYKGLYRFDGDTWVCVAMTEPTTTKVKTAFAESESISTEATTQSGINAEVVDEFKNLIREYDNLDVLTEDKIWKRIYKQTADSVSRVAGYYVYDFANHEWVSVDLIKDSNAGLRRLSKYLYEISFDEVEEYNQSNAELPIGGCTSIVKEGKLYRNYDFKYDDMAEFIVNATSSVGYFYTGMSAVMGMTPEDITEKSIKKLPHLLLDGVNEYGIMVSMHIVYNDVGYSRSGVTRAETLVSQILGTCQNLGHVEDINYKSLKVPSYFGDYVPVYLVSDGIDTIIIKPTATEYASMDWGNIGKLTNFVPEAEVEVVEKDEESGLYPEWLQMRPNGIARYNYARELTLEELAYTECYKNPTRLDEFIGIDGTNKNTSDDILTGIYNTAKNKYESRSRDGETWQTVHSVVYSNKGSMLHLWTQEDYDKDYCGGGSGEGTLDHRKLTDRDAENQHPIGAIEGLQDKIDDFEFVKAEAWTYNYELEEYSYDDTVLLPLEFLEYCKASYAIAKPLSLIYADEVYTLILTDRDVAIFERVEENDVVSHRVRIRLLNGEVTTSVFDVASVSKKQGQENSGKYLTVGTDGNVSPTEIKPFEKVTVTYKYDDEVGTAIPTPTNDQIREAVERHNTKNLSTIFTFTDTQSSNKIECMTTGYAYTNGHYSILVSIPGQEYFSDEDDMEPALIIRYSYDRVFGLNNMRVYQFDNKESTIEFFKVSDVFTSGVINVSNIDATHYAVMVIGGKLAIFNAYSNNSTAQSSAGWKTLLGWNSRWKYKLTYNPLVTSFADQRCSGSMWASNSYLNMAHSVEINNGVRSYYYNGLVNQSGGINMQLVFPVELR